MQENINNPKISVIMPNYNCEKYIGEAIESILNQTFINFEFIIIDDWSTDNSWNIIQEYVKKDERIIALKNETNLWVSKTRNKAINISKWEYIALMDSDDMSLLDRFEKQINFLDKNTDVGIIWGTMQIMDENGKVYTERRYNLTDEEIRKKLFRYSPFCHPLVMIRKTIILKSRLYNENINLWEDYDLYFRIWKFSKFANLEDILIKYRMFKNNSTTTKLNQMEIKTLDIRKKAVKEYWYKMSFWDKVYWVLQYLSIYMMPWKVKIWLFNLIRNK